MLRVTFAIGLQCGGAGSDAIAVGSDATGIGVVCYYR